MWVIEVSADTKIDIWGPIVANKTSCKVVMWDKKVSEKLISQPISLYKDILQRRTYSDAENCAVTNLRNRVILSAMTSAPQAGFSKRLAAEDEDNISKIVTSEDRNSKLE